MRTLKNLITVVAFSIFWVLLIYVNVYLFGAKGSLSIYGFLLIAYLLVKMSLSFFLQAI
ncbi:hyaluronan synthase [Streptococcus equi subsp. equi]|nr:hyaluronan synthase [Streptococcus equi subsp. equi]